MWFPRHAALLVSALLTLTSCGGVEPREPLPPKYYVLLRDGPCDGPEPRADTWFQPPDGQISNAGSGYIDSYGRGDRPPRTVLWMLGFSRYSDVVGHLVFVLLRVPNPPPLGTYPLRWVADSTVWLEEYTPVYRSNEVPFDMTEVGFVVQPFTGKVTIEESDSTGVIGSFRTQGSYVYDGVLRCMQASGRFSTRPS